VVFATASVKEESLVHFGRRTAFAGWLAIAILAACGHSNNVTTRSAGAGQSGGGTTVVPAGTEFYGKLERPIGSKMSKDGDTFSLDETRAGDPALKGAIVDGHLEELQSAGPMRNPKMTVVFDDVRMADGTKLPVNVQLVNLKAFSPQTHRLRTIGMMIGGAMAGHALAAKTGTKHAALMGAVSGYALSQQLKTDIVVPAGTVLEVKFLSPVQSGNTNSSPNS
jgi:hypothetical protein